VHHIAVTATHALSQPNIHVKTHAIHQAVTPTILPQFPVQSTASSLPLDVFTSISHCQSPVK
jgi:hypothetical protein